MATGLSLRQRMRGEERASPDGGVGPGQGNASLREVRAMVSASGMKAAEIQNRLRKREFEAAATREPSGCPPRSIGVFR
jgi:hypothetical protein